MLLEPTQTAKTTKKGLSLFGGFCFRQMVAGKEAAKPGEGKNSWLTGTAAWNWLVISQHILGIQPTYEGLRINPCIPADLKQYTVTRKWRDAEYVITIQNPNGKQHATIIL